MPMESGQPALFTDELTLCAQASGLEPERVSDLLQFARQRSLTLTAVLVDRGGVDECRLLERLALSQGLEFLDEIPPLTPEVWGQISPALAVRHQMVPLGEDAGVLKVACADSI